MMERGERPIAHRSRMTMLDRVEMDVVDVMSQIVVILDPMFPESTLPDAAFAP